MLDNFEEERSNSKKKIIIAIVIASVSVILIGTGIVCLGIFGRVKVDGTFLRNQKLQQDFDKKIMSSHVVFLEDEYNKFIAYKDSLGEIRNRNIFDKALDTLTGRDHEVKCKYDVDKDGLKKFIKKKNKKGRKPKSAKIIKKKKFFAIKSAKYGTKIVIKNLMKDLDRGDEFISVKNYVEKPKVLDGDLTRKLKKLNKPLKWHISYENGAEIRYPADAVTYKKGKVIVDDTPMHDIIYDALATYDTIGKTWKFKDHKGKKQEVTGGTWGSTVNYEEEIAFIEKAMSKKKSYNNRKPSLLRESPKNYSKTMIEVSIAKQHLWMYKGKKIVMQTDVVTGNPNKKRNTPVGMFYITERKPGKYLKGRGYKTWVDYWMRLNNNGVGLHDAPWQPYFGKTRYLTGGSHGCINLPADFAKKIYPKTEYGMTVVVH